jgi:hypothetical protein
MLFDTSKTKSDNGVVRTKSLFYELSYDNTEHVLFTLKDQDLDHNGRTYTSLSNLYRSLVPQDPTEYTFAMAVFGNWHVWDTIRNAPQLKPHVKKWRNEAEVKIKSEAIKAIALEAQSGGRSAFTAAKLLLERGWIEKEEVAKAKQKLLEKEEEELDKEAMRQLSADAERLGLNKFN